MIFTKIEKWEISRKIGVTRHTCNLLQKGGLEDRGIAKKTVDLILTLN